ncbi:anionic trypsin-2-like [Panulirus ornatus]|uniref:anionic trypsin-2-like n=1 Tax=Panulirus ornatus TaxID=150431 RepID=UPI003A85BD38
MMGWTGASRVYKNNTFGPGTGLVWLDDLRCIGYEASVKDCQHQPWGHTNCDHTEDVGLHCTDVETSASHDEIDARLEETTPLPMLPLTCGQRTVEDAPAAPMERPKIVSGVTPQPGAHPWMVAINLQTKSGPTQWCGGAVLGEEYVLTAAHCVKKYPPSTYLLRVGDFNTQEEEEEQQDFRVLSLAIHSKFDKGPFLNNDIAIIKIKKKNGKGIQFGKFVQPVCLVPQGWGYPPYINCTVAGWGSLGATLGFSKVLQSTLLPILPEETCQAEHVYGPTRLTKGMYCAGYLEGGIDTCQGDSGGPMVCLVNGRHTVVGITSWGHGCARPNKPGVYTKLTHYLHWLKSNLG